MNNNQDILSFERILIVEDELMQLIAYSSFLNKYSKNSIIQTNNVHDAKDLFKKFKDIDLCIVDMNLGVLNGLDFISYIRGFSEVPVIIISAYTDWINQHDEFFDDLKVSILQKPIKHDSILKTMRELYLSREIDLSPKILNTLEKITKTTNDLIKSFQGRNNG